jgi:hypothetical protein
MIRRLPYNCKNVRLVSLNAMADTFYIALSLHKMVADLVSKLLQFHFLLSLDSGLRRFSGLPVAFKGSRGAVSRRNVFIRATAEDQKDWDTISSDELADWQQEGPPTPLLDTVNFPVHIKNFNQRQLQQLCRELRAGTS